MDASPFSRLSVELRLAIYDAVFAQERPIEIEHNVDIKPDAGIAGTEDAFWGKYMKTLQPAKIEDVTFHLRSERKHHLAIAQTCRQMRIEATDRFFSSNSFLLDMDVDYFTPNVIGNEDVVNGRFYCLDQHPTLAFPLLKFLAEIEAQCEKARCSLPSIDVTYLVGDLPRSMMGLSGGVGLHTERAMKHLLQELLEAFQTRRAIGWDVEITVAFGLYKPSRWNFSGYDAFSRCISIKNGFHGFAQEIEDFEARQEEFEEDHDQYDGITSNIGVLRRWQEVFGS